MIMKTQRNGFGLCGIMVRESIREFKRDTWCKA